MSRRKMLKRTFYASTGLVLAARNPFLKNYAAAEAESNGFKGPYHLAIEMSGGWDTTQFCDPKDKRISGALNDEVTNIGAFSVPDHSHWSDENKADRESILEFFQTFKQDLLQIDGVRSGVTTHRFASQEQILGKAQATNYPSLMALLGADQKEQAALPLITNSNFSTTKGLIQSLQIQDADQISQLINPTVQNNSTFQSELDWTEVLNALKGANSENAKNSGLGSNQQFLNGINESHQAQSKMKELDGLSKTLIEEGVDPTFALTIAAFKLGLSATAQISLLGFDTHSQHFSGQAVALGDAFRRINKGLTAMKKAGLLEQTTVSISSEFGRTPYYGSWEKAQPLNTNAGKDHWNHSSMFFLGRGVKGNRRLGKTSERLESLPINYETLLPDENGHILSMPEIHGCYRRFAKLSKTFSDKYPIRALQTPKIFS